MTNEDGGDDAADVSLQPTTLLTRSTTEPDAIAVRFCDQRLTFSELEARALRATNVLEQHGVGEDGRWAILSHNRLEWAELLMANGRSGARVVLLNWHLLAAELRALLDDSQATLIVVDPELRSLADAAAVGSEVQSIIELGAEWDQLLADASAVPPTDRPCGNPLLYTGGTTGRSKGVNRSDQDRPASVWAAAPDRWGTLTGMPAAGVGLITTPLYHALGQGVLAACLARGHETVILGRFDPSGTLAAIADHAVTTTSMVPAQFVKLLKLDSSIRDRHDVSSLRWVLHSAAPCPPWVKREMIEWFGPSIVELYGSSEGAGPVIATSHDWLERPGTVGRASAALTLSVVDDDGSDLPPGEIGTIYIDRASGPPSYEGAPEKTAEMTLPDGRFTVGDVGWLDEDGYLFLADRRVDLILVGGSNVYPAEIEGVLVGHPDVADAAVFGIPHPGLGQEIKGVVEPVPGHSIDVAAVSEWLAERLAPFKLPRSIDVVDALPREEHGKLKKRLLRDPYWADQPSGG